MQANHLIPMRQRRRHKNKNSVAKRALQIFSILFVVIATISIAVPASAVAAASAVYSYFTQDLPDPTQIVKVQNAFQTTKLYDRTGKLLYEIIDPTGGDRQWVKFDDISPYLRCATVANEDRRFYENEGIDVRGTLRAVINNLQGGVTQGASNIAQQLVKNVITPVEERAGPKRTLTVKIREALLAMEITRRYDKKLLLEWYINTNFYGSLAYGIEAASRVYFNKSAKDLSLAEAAILAPIPQYPKQNPFDNPVTAKDRQAIALDAMVEASESKVPDCDITAKMAADAKRETLKLVTKQQRFNILAPHFSVYARDRAVELLADQRGIGVDAATELVNRGGLKIYTTLDLDVDDHIRGIANEKIAALQAADKKANNASVVVMKPGTGEIISMVGSLDYFNDAIDGKFNVATGLRQPGSSFKPITYIELLRQGSSLATLFWDVRTAFDVGGIEPYTPENYDRKYHGPVRLRLALARSYNIPAVESLRRAGIGNVIRTAHKLGINDLDQGLQHYGLALTLGGGEVKLLDMTYLYSVFANGGSMIGVPRSASMKRPGYRDLDPVAILRIEDSKGEVLYEYQPATNPNLLGANSRQLTYLLTSILSDPTARSAAFGYPSVLDLSDGRPAAVKTGTTNDNKDNWTMGYTPDYVVGVWVGNTDNSSMDRSVTGLSGAAPIWHDVMDYLHQDKPLREFERPDGLVERAVCQIDGLQTNGVCPAVTELFIEGTEPTQQSTIVQKFPINKETNRIAVAGTPPDKVEERIMYVFPPQAQDWYSTLTDEEKAAMPQPPTEYDTQYGGTIASGDVAITQPTNGGYVSATQPIANVEIRGNAKGGNWTAYKVFFGAGIDVPADQWQQIGPDHPDQVDNNLLENWNLAGIAPGIYSLKLSRIENDGKVTDSIIQVTVDNTAPTVKLIQPRDNEGFNATKDEWVDVNAQVQDDNTISRVEFFTSADPATPYTVKTVAPFNVKWTIKAGGTVEFWAVAYDGAGNRTESPHVRALIGGG
ncbi:MAG: transglycosylase domain-containing protein [Chloroflexi bacterium]|nr:transglycosylase domain-containing protein [Chloroflexota bacterium]